MSGDGSGWTPPERGGGRAPRAIVVGAGVGGLTAAGLLARRGYDVTVLERRETPGGRCGQLRVDGFTFDLGPTILLMPDVLRATFAALGRRLEDELELTRCEPNYTIHWRDGSSLTLSSDRARLAAAFERLEPGSSRALEAVLAAGARRYDGAMSRFVPTHWDSVPGFLSPSVLSQALRLGVHRKLFSDVAAAFKDERLRQALSFQTMYLGVSPYEAPAVFSLLPYTELTHGIWYPKGGLGAVPQALERVDRALGVRFEYGADVQRIVVRDGAARGVALADGRTLDADVVVCNADLPWARKHLLGEQRTGLERKRYTASGFLLYWGLKRRREELGHHTVFLGNDFKGSFERLFDRLALPEDPSFYVNVPSRTDASMAPAGKDAVYVLVPAPRQGSGLDWRVEGDRVRAHVLARLEAQGVRGLEADIEIERRMTPDDWASQLNLLHGSNFGLAQSLFQVGAFRPKVFDPTVGGLYFCGASAQPGTGVPTVMISARLAVEAIERRELGRAPAPSTEAA